MLNAKTISIVVAIFNRKDELFELLNSLIAQTDKDFEVIIVDDGSFVDLLPTVETFKEMLNIQYFKKKPNSGPGLSRNYGANRAKNDWLVFVDSDVIVEKDYIEKYQKNLEKQIVQLLVAQIKPTKVSIFYKSHLPLYDFGFHDWWN